MEGALLFYLYEEVGGESLARSMCGWGGGTVAGKSATLKMFKILMNGMVMRSLAVFKENRYGLIYRVREILHE